MQTQTNNEWEGVETPGLPQPPSWEQARTVAFGAYVAASLFCLIGLASTAESVAGAEWFWLRTVGLAVAITGLIFSAVLWVLATREVARHVRLYRTGKARP